MKKKGRRMVCRSEKNKLIYEKKAKVSHFCFFLSSNYRYKISHEISIFHMSVFTVLLNTQVFNRQVFCPFFYQTIYLFFLNHMSMYYGFQQIVMCAGNTILQFITCIITSTRYLDAQRFSVLTLLILYKLALMFSTFLYCF